MITSSSHASGTLLHRRAVLVVAHPGHELSLAGWLTIVRPAVFVMTNGSGLMPSYKWPTPPADRWAIIAYVRQLEHERAEAVARRATP